MSGFDETRVSRDRAGRFTTRPTGVPAVGLADTPAARQSRGRGRVPRTGVITTTPAVWAASTEVEALGAAVGRVAAAEARARRALAERELARAGVASTKVSVDEAARFSLTSIEPAPGRQVDVDVLCARLSRAVAVDLPGQTGYAGSTAQNTEDAFTTASGRPRALRGRDDVEAARASFDRSVARLRTQAARTITAVCLEAERQGAGRVTVTDGEAYTPGRDGRLRDEQGGVVSFGRAPASGQADEGAAVSAAYVQDVPGVLTGPDDSCFDIDVQAHLEAADVQAPGQTFIRV